MRFYLSVGLLLLMIGVAFGSPSVVQSAFTSASSTGAITLGSLAAVGNLEVACIGTSSVQNSWNYSSWNQLTAGGTGNGYIALMYRYAKVGDTTTLPAMIPVSGGFVAAQVLEIGGGSGNILGDLEQLDGKFNQTSATVTTNSLTTRANNDLVLTCGFNYDATTNITVSAGPTLQIQQNNFANYGAWTFASRSLATSGSVNSDTYTVSTTAHPFGYISMIVSGVGVGAGASNEQASKTNDYVDLRAGKAGNESVSKSNVYVVLQALHPGGVIFHSFPP